MGDKVQLVRLCNSGNSSSEELNGPTITNKNISDSTTCTFLVTTKRMYLFVIALHISVILLTVGTTIVTVKTMQVINSDKGPTGDKGLHGDKGHLGDKGPSDDKGPSGDKGPIDDKGSRGEKGIKGEMGVRRIVGMDGLLGTNGTDGEKGQIGENCIPGENGFQGTKGIKGEPGSKGNQGLVGESGEKGTKGELGSKGLPGEKGSQGEKGQPGEKATERACGSGWDLFGKYCYNFRKVKKTWQDAKMNCQRLGGNLVRIENAVENWFLKSMSKEMNYGSMWIGANDLDKEGQMVWVSDQTLVKNGFSDWSPGEPTNLNRSGRQEHCANLWDSRAYKWNDGWCSNKYGFICKK